MTVVIADNVLGVCLQLMSSVGKRGAWSEQSVGSEQVGIAGWLAA